VCSKLNHFSSSFCLIKKKQKIKAKCQLQFFSRSKSLRNAAEKIAVHTISPKAAAPLPTRAEVLINANKKKKLLLQLTHDVL
jgi:hypothetical protein